MDMELKVYGHYGKPVIVFPTQGGRFFEFEDFKMVEAIGSFIENGAIKLFTVDSIDNQTWSNFSIHPSDRARRHEAYDQYITNEVAPFIRDHCSQTPLKFLSTGCSMGAYHSANFFFRHPDIFDSLVSLSGPLSLKLFIGDYMDENVYLNSPISYLQNLDDPWYLDQYRQSKIVVCTGQGAWEEPMIEDAYLLKGILEGKSIPAWIDFWGRDVNHDWPWWRMMLPYFLTKLGFVQ
jgi:esterase/lipase superfamily enzyme